MGFTEPSATCDSRAEAEAIVKYLIADGLGGYMMLILDLVKNVHSPLAVCGWLVTDDNTGVASDSSEVPAVPGELVDSNATTTRQLGRRRQNLVV